MMTRLDTPSRRPGRATLLGALLAAMLLLSGSLESVGAQPVAEPIGYRGPGYASSKTSSPTSEKPESKLWWNDGYWWADLFNDATEAHHIYRLDDEAMEWLDTGVMLDERNKSRSDVLWDASSGKLYVASHKLSDTSEEADGADSGLLFRFSYDPATDTYSPDEGFPVVITPGRTQTLTLTKDASGRLWITFVWDSQVMISYSLEDDTLWSEPQPLPVANPNVTPEDISSVDTFGIGAVGVAWTFQAAEGDHDLFFATHQAGAPPEAWQQEVIATGHAIADNHLNMAGDMEGNLYLVTKTSSLGGDDPRVILYVRSVSGTWRDYVFGLGTDEHTRPIVVVDDEHDRLYIFATSPEKGGTIYYKTTPTSEIELEEGVGTPILRYPGADEMNNVTSTKQTVNSESGLLILASDATTMTYYFNRLDLNE